MSDIAVAPLSDGRLQVWFTTADNTLLSRWKANTGPDAQWTDWTSFPTPPGGVRDMTAAQLEDGRLQLFAIDPSGGTWSAWKTSTDPNAQWTEWTRF